MAANKFCIQRLTPSGDPMPGPTLIRSYDPDRDRYVFADTDNFGNVDWTTVAQFDTKQDAESALAELPEHVRTRFAVIEVAIPK